ncbi:MAG TPA: ATP-dependent RecD-like DNA helicase, partial [Ktedonobacterales bacterium]
ARFLPDPTHRAPGAANAGRRSSRSRQRGEEHLVTIVGTLLGVVAGEALELKGFWQHHAQHGWQFSVRDYRSTLPATAQGIRKYLGSGLIKGIGPKTAEKIVATFDLETLPILEEAPHRLIEVPGLGKRKVELITAAWEEQKAIKEVMLCLQELSVSTSLAVRIYKQYQDAAVTIVKNQPYRLARDVWGIGFKTADKIAQSLGYTQDHPERVKAGAFFALSEAADNDGHTYLPLHELARKAADLLGVSAAQVEQAVTDLALEGGVQLESWGEPAGDAAGDSAPAGDVAVYLRPFYAAERGIASNLWRLAACPPERGSLAELHQTNFAVMFDYLATRANISLAEQQQAGIVMALTHPVSVLTGGPGTGKTTSLRALIRVLTLKHKRVILAAPTGRAARRLSEATGIEAKTLHRLLQLRPGSQPLYDRGNPLPADMLIIDEVSMLDTLLMNSLLKGVATGTHVLLVGDADQLPSVGAGNVLADIISSGVVPVTRLEHIFRQGAGSAIATNARRINQGQMPVTGADMRDFFFIAQDDAAAARDTVVDLVARRIPARFGFRPEEIQVLAPMHRGACGVGELNERLQAALNPPAPGKEQRQYGGTLFRVGDKVLQLRNNYDKEVFNGDGGVIIGISAEEQTLTVRLDDGRRVAYEFGELDELALAYAVSIHKAQGSEYPVCVIPLVMEQYMLLERQLLYTAITRARQLAVLVGSKKALAIAVKNGPKLVEQPDDNQMPAPAAAASRHRSSRYTALSLRLRQRAGGPSAIKITATGVPPAPGQPQE